MNLSTPTSLQSKTKLLKNKIDQIYNQVSNKQQQKINQILRIQFITYLQQSIDKIQILNQSQSSQINNLNKPYNTSRSTHINDQYKQKYFQTQKQRILLQKKITSLLEKQIKQQQHALKLQRAQSESLKQKSKLQSTIKQLNMKIQKIHSELNHHHIKIKDQDKQIHRLITLNHKLNQEKDLVIQDRTRAQKKLHQLLQKYQGDQIAIQNKYSKAQKFNLKNTQGIKIIRILTNASSQKKPTQKYFILQLPAKIQIQKIVYGIRIGTINANKQITYYNQIFLYERDPLKLDMVGDNLSIQYTKRKQKYQQPIVFSHIKLIKPQVIILLYGKGDSVIVDQTK